MTASGVPVATAAEAKVVVAGNMSGSIVQGDRNLVVNSNYGTIVQESIQPTRTRRPIAVAPRPPRPFVGRSHELSLLARTLTDRGVITVSGPSGVGRTALMRAAASQAGVGLADGVLRVDGIDDAGVALSASDLAQRLHDAAWECVPAVKVDLSAARSQLGQIQALVLVDDVSLSGRDLERIADLVPAGAVVISTSAPAIDAELEDVPLGPLPRLDAIALLVAKAGMIASPEADPDLHAACALLADWPEAIVVAGRAMKLRGLTPAATRSELEMAETRHPEPGAAAIERAMTLAYPALSRDARRLLATAAVLPGKTHDPATLKRVLGDQPGFESAAETLRSLDLLTLNSPRLRIPDGIRAIAHEDAVEFAPGIADRHVETMVQLVAEHALDPDFVPTELAAITGAFDRAARFGRFDDAVDLGRAIAPYLVVSGLWDLWRSVAQTVRSAAEQTRRPTDIGWAAHELGTRELALDNVADAEAHLLDALEVRRRIGDATGAAYTLHNLRWLGWGGGGESDGDDGVDDGGSSGGALKNILLGGAAIAVVLVLLGVAGPTVAGFIERVLAPPVSPHPSESAAAEVTPSPGPTPTPSPTPAPTPTPTLTPTPQKLEVVASEGGYAFDARRWVGTLTIAVHGGEPPYHVVLEDQRESNANPATFEVLGTPCEARQISGTASSGDGQSAPFAFTMTPIPCATPVPIDVACIDFESLGLDSFYGAKGQQQPGDVILKTPEGMSLAVEEFDPLDGSRSFDYGIIRDQDPYFGNGHWMDLHDLAVELDFSGLPFRPSRVEFRFQDRDGSENLAINGGEIYAGELTKVPNPFEDVVVDFNMAYDDVGPASGRAILTGTIDRLRVGGQANGLDTICAYRGQPTIGQTRSVSSDG